jgi:hypothetical protein
LHVITYARRRNFKRRLLDEKLGPLKIGIISFVGPDGVIGTYTGPVMHRIDLIDPTKFISERPRRVPPALEEVVEEQIREMH